MTITTSTTTTSELDAGTMTSRSSEPALDGICSEKKQDFGNAQRSLGIKESKEQREEGNNEEPSYTPLQRLLRLFLRRGQDRSRTRNSSGHDETDWSLRLLLKCPTRRIKRKLSDPEIQAPRSLAIFSSLSDTRGEPAFRPTTISPDLSSSPSFDILSTVVSVCFFILLDVTFHHIMKIIGWTFPHSLVGCITLFSIFLLTTLTSASTHNTVNSIGSQQTNSGNSEKVNVMSPSSPTITTMTDNVIYHYFQPGADFFAKWLPVLFCPILITLPVTDTGIVSANEVSLFCLLS